MARKQNPLDWYRDNVCVDCDRPTKDCLERPVEELACLLAYVARLLTRT